MMIHCRTPDGDVTEVDPESELLVRFPGAPSRLVRVRDLALLMGDDERWPEFDRAINSR